MDKIQEDAMRRVQQMQAGNVNRNSQPRAQTSNEAKEREEPKLRAPQLAESASENPLDGLFKDKEKLLILLLIMLLSEESTNTELTLALLYIII